MNDQKTVHPIHAIRGVFSVLIGVSVVMLVGLAGALLIGILTIAGQAMTSGIYLCKNMYFVRHDVIEQTLIVSDHKA